MFGRRRKRDNPGESPTSQLPDGPQVFSIGGVRIAFQETGHCFRLTAEGDPKDKQSAFNLIDDTIKGGGRSLSSMVGVDGQMDISLPMDTKQGFGTPPPASKADILHALARLQTGSPTRNDLLDCVEDQDGKVMQNYQTTIKREAVAKTSHYFLAVIRYLENTGYPLGKEHQEGLRDAIAGAYLESQIRR
jgi:hypothetical protein